ncbi:MAG: DoxX family protein [Gemmatimonadetes bacterium]|nr:DoxX family protein [Gemmatimonadota bacterium]
MTSEGARSGIPHFFLNALRIVVALMFMQHGATKLLMIFGAESAAEFLTQRWFAGVLELYGGGLLVVGLFTRPVAFLLAGEMAFAYFMAHFPRGWVPVMNGGELSVLFCWTFLFLAANGGGSFSLDGLLAARRAAKTAG